MQSEALSEQGSSAHQEQESTPLATSKRRRQSERPATQPSEASNAPALSGPTSTLKPSEHSPQRRGSSRESDMHRSSTPPEGSSSGTIKYTRTGRVSKATKGQRVHHCDECGKTYTRAEHLRRHQQNHKPGAFPCDVPGCGRSFYREDLLIRHKARHNDPLNPPSRRASIGSQQSDQPVEPDIHSSVQSSTSRQRPSATDSSLTPLDLPADTPPTTAQQAGSSRTPRKGYLNINELPRQPVASQAISIDTSGPIPDYPFGQLWEPSPPYSPIGYESPPNGFASGPPYFSQPQVPRVRNGSSASFGGCAQPYASRSPISAGSSSAYLSQWGPRAQSPAFNHFSSSSSSDNGFYNNTSLYSMFGDQHLIPAFLDGIARMMSAEERDVIEQQELVTPSASPRSSLDNNFNENSSFTNDQRYLGAYWRWVHSLFPVVHRPSFSFQHASPLLRSAMLALGAHMLQDRTDMSNARIIHERCAKVLKKRNVNNWHTYRVCDMQAIFLCEVYSIFKSRRPPLQFSKNFEDIYRMLADDPHALSPGTASPLNDGPMNTSAAQPSDYQEGLTGGMIINQDAKCKQRLLLACYILDQQHATLFGRAQTTCLSILGLNLPFSRSQMYWDAPPEQQFEVYFQRRSSGIPCYSSVYEAMNAVPTMTETSQDPHDAFRSLLMMACFTDSNNNLQSCDYVANDSTGMPPMLYAVEQSLRMRLAYHMFMLCKHTPVRDLLAVAGESWCMAEKLSSQNDYAAAQLLAFTWAKGFTDTAFDSTLEQDQSPVQRALNHARQILDIHSRHPKTGMLFQEWAIYLAAVVVWAWAYVTSNEPRQKPRPSIPTPTPSEPRPSTHELERTVTAFINAEPSANFTLSEARNILLWTKAKIEKVDIPHNCGLTNGALDVLGKLVSRGAESGWFGEV